MSQRWCDLLFAHWPVPAAKLRPEIPARLEIDTCEGTTWIAAVPFRSLLEGAGLANAPGETPHLLFARSLDVKLWPLCRV